MAVSDENGTRPIVSWVNPRYSHPFRLCKDRYVTEGNQGANLKPKARDYRVADSGGLYVLVRPNDSKLWRYDYRLGGDRRTFSIGAYSDASDGVDYFTLKQARDEHEKAREAVKSGQHPSTHRNQTTCQQHGPRSN